MEHSAISWPEAMFFMDNPSSYPRAAPGAILSPIYTHEKTERRDGRMSPKT